MTPPPTEQYWLSRAQEVRSTAREIDDPQTRQKLERVAETYERLAELARQRYDQ